MLSSLAMIACVRTWNCGDEVQLGPLGSTVDMAYIGLHTLFLFFLTDVLKMKHAARNPDINMTEQTERTLYCRLKLAVDSSWFKA